MKKDVFCFLWQRIIDVDIVSGMVKKYNIAGAFVLGMHDALVSLTGMIAGLTFALADRVTIVLSAIIASVSAGLSMAASNYLAEKTNNNQNAIRAGVVTGTAYIGTCALLILPFLFITQPRCALISCFIIAIIIIFACNWCIRRAHNRHYMRHAIEMLMICATVAIVTFVIGELARYILGITI